MSFPGVANDPIKPRFRFTVRGLLIAVTVACGLFAVLAFLARAVHQARRAALGAATEGQMCQLVVALHNYHDTYGCFPPAVVADEQGRPLHSWRVLLLPWLEEKARYDAYDFKEPWDGPNNSRLLQETPAVFRSRRQPHLADGTTNFVVLTGLGTAFPGVGSTRLADFADGAENTILLMEVDQLQIPWSAPRDLTASAEDFRIKGPQGEIALKTRGEKPLVVFADSCHAYSLDPAVPPKDLHALTTVRGREEISRETVIRQGWLE